MRYYLHTLPNGKWYMNFKKQGAHLWVEARSYLQALSLINNL